MYCNWLQRSQVLLRAHCEPLTSPKTPSLCLGNHQRMMVAAHWPAMSWTNWIYSGEAGREPPRFHLMLPAPHWQDWSKDMTTTSESMLRTKSVSVNPLNSLMLWRPRALLVSQIPTKVPMYSAFCWWLNLIQKFFFSQMFHQHQGTLKSLKWQMTQPLLSGLPLLQQVVLTSSATLSSAGRLAAWTGSASSEWNQTWHGSLWRVFWRDAATSSESLQKTVKDWVSQQSLKRQWFHRES